MARASREAASERMLAIADAAFGASSTLNGASKNQAGTRNLIRDSANVCRKSRENPPRDEARR